MQVVSTLILLLCAFGVASAREQSQSESTETQAQTTQSGLQYLPALNPDFHFDEAVFDANAVGLNFHDGTLADEIKDDFFAISKIQADLRTKELIVKRQREMIEQGEQTLAKYRELLDANKAIFEANKQKLAATAKFLADALARYGTKLAAGPDALLQNIAQPSAAAADASTKPSDSPSASATPATTTPSTTAATTDAKPATTDASAAAASTVKFASAPSMFPSPDIPSPPAAATSTFEQLRFRSGQSHGHGNTQGNRQRRRGMGAIKHRASAAAGTQAGAGAHAGAAVAAGQGQLDMQAINTEMEQLRADLMKETAAISALGNANAQQQQQQQQQQDSIADKNRLLAVEEAALDPEVREALGLPALQPPPQA